MDRTEIILKILNLFLAHEQKSSNPVAKYKVRAYENAIQEVKNYGNPIVNEEDIAKITGIGEKIRKKLIEIVQTGTLKEAESLKEVEKVREELLDIYGIGPKKADELIDKHLIRSIPQIQELALNNPELFTDSQLLGLAYYSDLKQRIPRVEMTQHETFLREFFLKLIPEFSITIVGSYRRGLETSGDIDLLLTYHGITHNEASKKFQECISKLLETEYIIGVLAKGKSKFLGICQLEPGYLARRIDILLTPPEEMPYALLYFTGSKEFNIKFRNVAISKGYTMNEHRMTKILPVAPDIPEMKTERDVFKFLRIMYTEPEKRDGSLFSIVQH